jgi:hypothetical protein
LVNIEKVLTERSQEFFEEMKKRKRKKSLKNKDLPVSSNFTRSEDAATAFMYVTS